MKLKLGNSIALSMGAMLFLSMMAIFPASSVATPKIYMDPAVNEVGKDHLEGAGIGFKWNITLWVTGYGTPPVFAWQVSLLYDLVAGINCTRAWVANFDPAYIFVDAGPGVTYPVTEVVTPSPQDILIWNTTVVDLENPVSEAWRWTDGTNEYNVHDYVPNRSGKFGPCAFLRLGNISGPTTWCHIESVAGNLQVVVKQAAFAKVGDTLTTQPAQGPPPDPAKLAIFEFEIIYAPPSGKVFSNLEIDNEDTFLLDYDYREVLPIAKEKGYYEYEYAVVNLEVKPNQHIADKLETFNVTVWLNNVTESDRVIGAQFRLQYNATLLAVKNVSEGPFFREFKSCPEEPYTQFVWYNITSRDEDPQNYDLLGPHILVSVVILSYEGQYSVFPNGSGILATVTFRGIYRSLDEALNSPLELSDIIVVDDAKPEPNVIATTSPINGYYEISPMQPPTADFTFAPDFPIAEQSVTFNASSSYDLDGYIVSYVWDFGDGNTTTVTSSVITHSYVAPDTYNVTLTVIDNDELSDSDAKTVIVEAQPVDILLYVAIIAVLATIIIVAAVVTYYKRIRK